LAGSAMGGNWCVLRIVTWRVVVLWPPS
jgi:hypothetical protein